MQRLWKTGSRAAGFLWKSILLMYCPGPVMLHWHRWIKPLWWEGIICSPASKQAFVWKQTREIFAWQNQGMKPPSQVSEAENIRFMIYVPEILLSLSTLNWVSTKGLLALASCREFRAKQQCWQNPQMQKCHLTAQQHRTAPSSQGRAAGIPFPLHFTWADVKMQRPQHHGGN